MTGIHVTFVLLELSGGGKSLGEGLDEAYEGDEKCFIICSKIEQRIFVTSSVQCLIPIAVDRQIPMVSGEDSYFFRRWGLVVIMIGSHLSHLRL